VVGKRDGPVVKPMKRRKTRARCLSGGLAPLTARLRITQLKLKTERVKTGEKGDRRIEGTLAQLRQCPRPSRRRHRLTHQLVRKGAEEGDAKREKEGGGGTWRERWSDLEGGRGATLGLLVHEPRQEESHREGNAGRSAKKKGSHQLDNKPPEETGDCFKSTCLLSLLYKRAGAQRYGGARGARKFRRRGSEHLLKGRMVNPASSFCPLLEKGEIAGRKERREEECRGPGLKANLAKEEIVNVIWARLCVSSTVRDFEGADRKLSIGRPLGQTGLRKQSDL